MPAPALAPPELAIVRAINVQRTAHGRPALRIDRRLARSAERHSRDQLRHDRLEHTSSDGTPFPRRIRRAGRFRTAGEVIAFAPRGSSSRARAIVRMWMGSPPHRVQMLSASYRIVGVGKVRGGLRSWRGALITADFAAR